MLLADHDETFLVDLYSMDDFSLNIPILWYRPLPSSKVAFVELLSSAEHINRACSLTLRVVFGSNIDKKEYVLALFLCWVEFVS